MSEAPMDRKPSELLAAVRKKAQDHECRCLNVPLNQRSDRNLWDEAATAIESYERAVAKAEDHSGLKYYEVAELAMLLEDMGDAHHKEREAARLLRLLWETLVGECLRHQITIEQWAWETKPRGAE
jgi:hypothetical protein